MITSNFRLFAALQSPQKTKTTVKTPFVFFWVHIGNTQIGDIDPHIGNIRLGDIFSIGNTDIGDMGVNIADIEIFNDRRYLCGCHHYAFDFALSFCTVCLCDQNVFLLFLFIH